MAIIQNCSRMTRIVALALAICACGSSPAAAQSQDAPATSPADVAFETLAKDMHRLHQSLVNKGGIAKEDQAIITAMRDRVVAFSQQFPNDVRAPKLELALAKWLKDEARVTQLFARIVELEPNNDIMRISWAKLLRSENRYAEAIDVFRGNQPDPVTAGEDLMLMADCLFAEHQFDEALALLESIPESAISTARKSEFEERKKFNREIISAWGQEQLIRQKEEQADDLPRVMMVTSRGPITLELFENEAPNTVANFISLIEKGFYNTSKFHRVLPNFMAQGGDPFSKPGGTGTPGMGDPGYFIPDEIGRDDHRKHFTGSLSMAKTEAPNTGGCQFFLTVTPTPHLDGKHTVFGRVLEGLDIVRSLQQDDVIQLVTVIRKRDHEYVPSTLPKDAPPVVLPAVIPPELKDVANPPVTSPADAPPAGDSSPSQPPAETPRVTPQEEPTKPQA